MTHDSIPTPIAIWTGRAPDRPALKIGAGLLQWRPEAVACEIAHEDGLHLGHATRISAGLPPEEIVAHLRALGVRCVLSARSVGEPDPDVIVLFACALRSGMHVASGAHARLADVPMLMLAGGSRIHDFRHGQRAYPLGTGRPRRGLRLLTIGPDGNVGKKYAALAVHRALRSRGVPATFCATGQTGRLLCGPEDRWIVMDTVPSDFATGAAEWLSPDHADPGHWYVIEGQANPWHPAWGPPSLGLFYGSRPDAVLYCGIPGRRTQRYTDRALPTPRDDVASHLGLAETMGFVPRLVGVAYNPSEAEPAELDSWLSRTRELGVPVFNPLVDSVAVADLARCLASVSAAERRDDHGG